LFLLQIIKFEEIRKSCSYIIVYNNLYTIINRSNSNFTKEKRNMNIYRHILYIIIYVYIYLNIYIYISYIKKFLPGNQLYSIFSH